MSHAVGARRGELDPNSELSAIEQVQQREALGSTWCDRKLTLRIIFQKLLKNLVKRRLLNKKKSKQLKPS